MRLSFYRIRLKMSLMTGEYIEERNGGYYIAGTRISLDSVVYSFERGNSPEAIQESYPLPDLRRDRLLFGPSARDSPVSGGKGNSG
jgi:hypothetical protein